MSAQITVTQEGGQIRIQGTVPAEAMLLLLTQAIEIVRVQVVAKAVADLPPAVKIESALPGSLNGGAHGLRGGDATFRRGTIDG